MPFDWSFIALAIPAVIFAGISKGGFGSGAAFASAAWLSLIVDPGLALALMLPLLMLIDFTTLKAYWRLWDTKAAFLLSWAAIPGIVLGVLIYRLAEPDHIRLLIGVISILFVLWQIAKGVGVFQRPKTTLGSASALLLGFGVGFTSFVSHAGGPLAAIYLLSKKLGKTEFQATTIVVFTVVNLMKIGPYAALGIFTPETLTASLLLSPFAVLGAWLGVLLHRWVSERFFFGLTYVLLMVTGLKLVWDGLT